jgi:hypothetical protein
LATILRTSSSHFFRISLDFSSTSFAKYMADPSFQNKLLKNAYLLRYPHPSLRQPFDPSASSGQAS